MRKKINAAVADVEARHQAGQLPWTWATVQSLIGRYPKRGQLDVLKPGQEDEATPDPDGVPWELERAGEKEGAEGSSDEDCEPEGGEDGCDAQPAREVQSSRVKRTLRARTAKRAREPHSACGKWWGLRVICALRMCSGQILRV